MKHHGLPRVIVTDKLRSYGAAINVIGSVDRHAPGRSLNNRAENSHQPFRLRERAFSGSGKAEPSRHSPPSTRP